MKTPRARIAHAIATRSLNGTDSKQLSQEVAAYLLSEGRVSELNSLMREVQADWATAGYVEVLASCAHPLTADLRDSIELQVRKLYPAAKQILVTEVRDAKVLGGVQLRLADQQLDMSVESKLNKFKQLTNGDR